MNHEANPPWLPELLSRLVPALRDIYAEVDVLAFSRGVQAFLSCVPHISSPRWLRDVTNVYLAGGCVWQRQSAEHRKEVLRGLERWCEAKDGELPLSLVVLSRMDATVRFCGAYSKKKGRNRGTGDYRVDYGPPFDWLSPFAKKNGALQSCQSFGGLPSGHRLGE